MSISDEPATTLDPAAARLSIDVQAGDGWTYELAAGETLRIVDLHGNQAVDTLFFDAHDYANRYSAVDTLREQGSAYLTLGSRLLALDGEPLVTITADTCGRHDTSAGPARRSPTSSATASTRATCTSAATRSSRRRSHGSGAGEGIWTSATCRRT